MKWWRRPTLPNYGARMLASALSAAVPPIERTFLLRQNGSYTLADVQAFIDELRAFGVPDTLRLVGDVNAEVTIVTPDVRQ